ncbi:GNAT family N-acetyltransferase [Gymnodinialimonas ceratoperidinii]|uniref:GNAT family N-acetyltransferase n=1 Tax=Gymnodinialimonas ceratoperidinii TaxID=2856823 RepID=A0A8F6TZ98_9RHOB|nr:GNAT family N-acetyltransferase [Gymnodinialimonas ceratoperidinii]QXT40739.1 GNAT family N-acetyltransferase [Gymnodinialimonas ceratoperidinii]
MITRASLSDRDAVLTLWNEVIAETAITFTSTLKTPDQIADLIASQPVFVARDGARTLGFATYAQFRGGDGYRLSQEHAIYLSEAARGRGLGRALLGAVEDHARAAGHRTLIAGVSGENAHGLAFHDAMGFSRVGHLAQVGHKFGRFIDLVLMQKLL